MNKFKTRITLKIIYAFIVSLGVFSLPFLVIGLKYNCTGQDVFPTFFASPFIFKSTSLATSLAYDYYTLGLLGNCVIWCALFFALDYMINKCLRKIDKRFLRVIYKWIVGAILVLSVFSIYLELSVCTQTISMKANLNKESKDWGMKCKGKFVMLR